MLAPHTSYIHTMDHINRLIYLLLVQNVNNAPILKVKRKGLFKGCPGIVTLPGYANEYPETESAASSQKNDKRMYSCVTFHKLSIRIRQIISFLYLQINNSSKKQ